jgi:hypothetical protein
MYVSHQALRILARDRMTATEQRQADDQLGQIVAALARSGRRFADQARALARPLAVAGQRSASFRKVGEPQSRSEARDSAACFRKMPETIARTASTGAKR